MTTLPKPLAELRDELAGEHAQKDFDPQDLADDRSSADYVCCKEDFKAGFNAGAHFGYELSIAESENVIMKSEYGVRPDAFFSALKRAQSAEAELAQAKALAWHPGPESLAQRHRALANELVEAKARNAELCEMIFKHAKRASDNLRDANETRDKLATALSGLERIEIQNLDGLSDCPRIARETLAELKGPK